MYDATTFFATDIFAPKRFFTPLHFLSAQGVLTTSLFPTCVLAASRLLPFDFISTFVHLAVGDPVRRGWLP